MPAEADPGRLASAWLKRARGNLARARQPKPAEGFWEDLCFDAQQAAEKAVKAVMIVRGIEFPRTHQLGELLVLLRQAGHDVPEAVWRARDLSDYAVDTRYPVSDHPVDPIRPVSEEEYQRAVAVADDVVRWAERVIHAA